MPRRVPGSMQHPGPGPAEIEDLTVRQQPVRLAGLELDELGQKLRPAIPGLFIELIRRKKLIDENVHIFENGGVEFMHPKLRSRKKVIVKNMIFMPMAVDDHIDGPLPANRQELFFIAGRIDDGANFIVDQDAVALGIFPAANKPQFAPFKIKHRLFPSSET